MSWRTSFLCLPALLSIAGCSNSGLESRFVRGDAESIQEAEALATRILAESPDSLLEGVDDFVVSRTHIDEIGMAHTRVRQVQGGVPVFGGDAVVHLDLDGSLRDMTDGFLRQIDVDTDPTIARLDAIASVVDARTGESDLSATPVADLRVLRWENTDRLAWRVRVQLLDQDPPSIPLVFVDAHTGEALLSYDDLHTSRDRATYDANNGSSLPGTLARGEGDAATGDAALDAAHDNAGATWDCYDALFGRDSYDDAGATLRSTAHYLSRYNNAFWNGSQMVYGDGDGSLFSPLSESLDVVAHELTHAVTDYESSLIYQGESGALNEAMSDVFGATCEWYALGQPATVPSQVWDIGDEIFTPGQGGDALRYMDDPQRDGSSTDYYPTRYQGSQDNGGVHWNSGIANLAFYLLSEGGTHPRGATSLQVPGIGIERAARIFYRANTVYLGSSSGFDDARLATERAATDLFGTAEVEAVGLAWAAVGVGNAAPTDPGGCPWSPGDWNYCLDCGPCGPGEGDCDGDAECGAGTVCVDDVGATYGWASTVDVCELPASSCPWSPGDWDYCKDCGPCEAGGGDCDGDAECAAGLTCLNDVGGNYGYERTVDVCDVSPVPTCPWSPGDYEFCRDCGPCFEGEGDCDADSECDAGLVCVSDVGGLYGYNADVDVCEAPVESSCPWNPGDYDFCRDCGPCFGGEGDCDATSECAYGLSCISNVGSWYGYNWDVDVCE